MQLHHLLLSAALFFTYNFEAFSMENITLDRAREIAQNTLSETSTELHVTYLADDIKEYPFGWVFKPITREFLETNDRKYLLIGVGPLVVERNGTTHSIPVKVIFRNKDIGDYLRELKSKQ